MSYPTDASFVLTSVAATSGGNTVYTGTITGGGTNNFVGQYAVIAGFAASNGANNSPPSGFLVVANSTTTVTCVNNSGVSETLAGSMNLIAVNNYGPYTPNYTNSSGQTTPFSSPPAPGLLIPYDAPGFDGLVADNFVNSWPYTNTKKATQQIVSSLVSATNNGISFNFNTPVAPSTLAVTPQNFGGTIVNSSASNVTSIVFTSSNAFQASPIPGPSVGLKLDVQSTPTGPGGGTVQGTLQINNAAAVCTAIAGLAPQSVAFVQWSGAYQNP